MLLPFLRSPDDHEAWFAQHYDTLLQWAVQITAGDRGQAEDLVHDAFVLFMARRPDLSTVERVNGYLYTSLRNLHLSNARRAARRRETVVRFSDFDLLDYDSLRSSLQVMQERHAAEMRAEFQHQLRAVWCYAQVRKRSSKMASVLTLRFFHGYYPEEITRVLRISRDTTDQLLRRARKEARAFSRDPQAMSAAHEAVLARAWPAERLVEPPDLALALHEAALRSDPDGDCLTDADLAARYGSADPASADPASADPASGVSTEMAAHVVSCRACLARITDRLGLPPLATRHPLDRLGYDADGTPPDDDSGTDGLSGGGSRGGSGSGSGGRRAMRQRLDAGRRRLSALRAQAPDELRFSVNGAIIGSQQVTSSTSRLTLRLAGPDLDFFEIFSEQDVRLLFVNLEAPPRGPIELRESMALNDGRRIDAHVSFAGVTPVVQVSYVDPALAPSPIISPIASPIAPTPASSSSPPRTAGGGVWRFFGQFSWGYFSRWRLIRGGLFTTMVLATVLVGLLVNQLGRPVLSAAELLRKATAAQDTWTAQRTLAVHRTLELEARAASGATMRRRVEVWHSAARGLTVRRAYDERGELLAAEWIEANGTHTVRRRAGSSAVEPTVQGVEAWRIELSVAGFTRIVGSLEPLVASRRAADGYLVSFENGAAAGPALLAASLALGADYKAVEQRATVRTASETTEFTWTERTSLTRSAGSVPDDIFELDPGFTADSVPAPAAASPMAIAPVTPGLELTVLSALRRIDADLGEEVRVRRANGRLEIAGVVASAQRQAQIRALLADVARHPAVRVRIDTVSEAHARARRRGTPAPVDVGDDASPLPVGAQRIPVHEPIRQYLVFSGIPASQADDEVARVANDLLAQVNRMRLHAWALRNLLDRIPAADVGGLGADDRARWRALIADHTREFLHEAEAFRRLAAPVFPEGATPRTAAVDAPLSDDALGRSSARLAERAVALNAMIEAACTLPASGRASAAAFDPRRFWEAFTEAAALAESVRRSAQTSVSVSPTR